MNFNDDLKEIAQKALDVTKSAAEKISKSVVKYGDAGVVQVELFQLEKQLSKIESDFGELVSVRLLEEGKDSVSKDEKDISVYLNEISRLKSEIDKRKKIEEKTKNN